MIGSWPALRGGPSTIFQLYRHSLLCTYCTNSRSRTNDRDKTKITPTKAGEERKCQRTAEVTDPQLAAAAWESYGEAACTLLVREMPSVRMRIKCSDCCRGL
jgi:hypothetical protein